MEIEVQNVLANREDSMSPGPVARYLDDIGPLLIDLLKSFAQKAPKAGNMSLIELLEKKGPRKLLALDGGGIHGLISLEILGRIEQLLRAELGRDERLVLADYFDYMAGTSTGAIIAAGLSIGMKVAEVRAFYTDHAQRMFRKASVFKRHLYYKYLSVELAGALQEVFGPTTELGSPMVRTLLMIMLRNATTDSPWPVSNNPSAKYNRLDLPSCNLKLPLWKLIRASTAAPIFFPPEKR